MHKQLVEVISLKHTSNFLLTFLFLPKERREAMITVYNFCRTTDDIVDLNQFPLELRVEMLNEWREEFDKSLSQKSNVSLLNKLAKVIQEFKIPIEHFYHLMDGMEMDLKVKRYSTFDELYQYCYRVASTVGLISIEIFNYKDDRTKDYAINLGIALQLTNILRDIKEDLLNDRIYLPSEDFIKFNYSEDELKSQILNNNYLKLMEYETNRAQSYFEKTVNFLSSVDRKNLYPAESMKYIYQELLNKIRKNNYDVFHKKVAVSKIRKLAISLNSWLKSIFSID